MCGRARPLQFALADTHACCDTVGVDSETQHTFPPSGGTVCGAKTQKQTASVFGIEIFLVVLDTNVASYIDDFCIVKPYIIWPSLLFRETLHTRVEHAASKILRSNMK